MAGPQGLLRLPFSSARSTTSESSSQPVESSRGRESQSSRAESRRAKQGGTRAEQNRAARGRVGRRRASPSTTDEQPSQRTPRSSSFLAPRRMYQPPPFSAPPAGEYVHGPRQPTHGHDPRSSAHLLIHPHQQPLHANHHTHTHPQSIIAAAQHPSSSTVPPPPSNSTPGPGPGPGSGTVAPHATTAAPQPSFAVSVPASAPATANSTIKPPPPPPSSPVGTCSPGTKDSVVGSAAGVANNLPGDAPGPSASGSTSAGPGTGPAGGVAVAGGSPASGLHHAKSQPLVATGDWANELVQLAKTAELKKHSLTLQLHTAHIVSAHAMLEQKDKATQDIREQKHKLDSERVRLLNSLAEINADRDKADLTEAALSRECTELRQQITVLQDGEYAIAKRDVDRLRAELGQAPLPPLQTTLEEKTFQYLRERRMNGEKRPANDDGQPQPGAMTAKRPRGRPKGSKNRGGRATGS